MDETVRNFPGLDGHRRWPLCGERRTAVTARAARVLPAAGLVLALAAGAAACGGTAVVPGVGSIKQSPDKKSITYSNKSGSYTMSGNDQLPQGFPRDQVPLPAGYRVSGSQSVGSQGSEEYMVYLTLNGTPQALSDAYQAQLRHAGYQITGTTSTDGTTVVGAQGRTWSVEATVTTNAAGGGSSQSLRPGQSMMELIVGNANASSGTTTSGGGG